LVRKWLNYCGRPVGIELAAIDAGYSTDDVLNYARRYAPSKLIAVRGAAGDTAPRIAKVQRERDEKRGTLRKYGGRFYNVGVSTLKWSLYRDLLKDDSAAPGYVSFPNNCEDRYFQELVSETRVAVKRLGQTIWKWEKPDRQANKCLDTMIYASAAAIKFGVNWLGERHLAELEASLEPPAKGAAPPPAAKRENHMRTFVSKIAHARKT
jgi:phage terminase large subunit GpA-like protein